MPLIRRLAALFRRRRLDDELRDEIQLHLELRQQALVDEGLDPGEAERQARRTFGNVTAIRETTRDLWGFPSLDSLAQDLRYGARILRRSPTFTIVAVVSLAIGIGASAAVFSLADAMLFRLLPVRSPDELLVFRWVSNSSDVFESLNGYGNQEHGEYSSTSFSRIAYDTMRARLAGEIDLFGFADLYRVNLSVDGRPETGYGQVVTGNYFQVLGLVPAAGRLLVESDDRPEAPAAAVISLDYWRRRFGESTAAIGQSVAVNGLTFTIVGVAPESFRGTLQVGQPNDVFVPQSMYRALHAWDDDPADPNFWWMLIMGRVKAGIAPDRVRSAADLILKQTVSAARPALPAKDLPRVTVQSGARGQLEERDSARRPLAIMALIVAIVLLVACANVANLLLARGNARERELAVRVAIGAPRTRVVRQLLTEGVLLAALGGALGLVTAGGIAAALLQSLGGPTSAFALDVRLDWRVLAFSILVATASSLVFGLVPAVRGTAGPLALGVRDALRTTAGGRQRSRLAGALVATQVALSMLLVTAAGLGVSSVWNLRRVDLGFDPEHLLIFSVDGQLNGYDEGQTRRLYQTALERLSALPGVVSASLASHTLIANSSSIGVARAAGAPAPARGSPDFERFVDEHLAWRLVTDERFLETMRIPLRRGRVFTPADTETSARVAIINESLARQLFGTTEAVGRRFALGTASDAPEFEIIGLSADAKYTSIRANAPPTVYLTYRQRPLGRATFLVRSAGDPLDLAGTAREALREIDPTLPLFDIRTQHEQILRSLRGERLFATLATSLGAVTLLLASIGLYGVLAYSVIRRTPEIGVRMALGAERASVRWMVLRHSLVLVAAGLAVGIPSALAGTRILQSMLFGLSAHDPSVIGAATALLTAASLAAAYVPARRASRVDPIVALRTE